MKDFLSKLRVVTAVLAIACAATLPPEDLANAQAVTQLPVSINPNSVVDFGNGPQELRTVLGNAWVFTEQGAGLGSTSGSSQTITLTAVPANPPCVGCLLTQVNQVAPASVTSVTVTSYNSVTSLTVSSALTLGAGTSLAWGSACPAFAGGLPAPNLPLQAGGAATDLPMSTLARICGYAANGPGATVLPFPVGAH
jgi:hypothetical protein